MSVLSCVILALLVPTEPAPAAAERGPEDAFCGARCVQLVLEHFGRHEELTDLIAELHGPQLRQRVSFAELARALEKRSVHCRFVRLGPLETASWKHPVIAHVDGKHFVVVSGSSGLSAMVWDGFKGRQEEYWWSLKKRSSPIILLTCDRPIADDERYAGQGFRAAAIVLVMMVAAGGVYLASRVARRLADFLGCLRHSRVEKST